MNTVSDPGATVQSAAVTDVLPTPFEEEVKKGGVWYMLIMPALERLKQRDG